MKIIKFLIAEIGVNHNGDIKIKQLIDNGRVWIDANSKKEQLKLFIPKKI